MTEKHRIFGTYSNQKIFRPSSVRIKCVIIPKLEGISKLRKIYLVHRSDVCSILPPSITEKLEIPFPVHRISDRKMVQTYADGDRLLAATTVRHGQL